VSPITPNGEIVYSAKNQENVTPPNQEAAAQSEITDHTQKPKLPSELVEFLAENEKIQYPTIVEETDIDESILENALQELLQEGHIYESEEDHYVVLDTDSLSKRSC